MRALNLDIVRSSTEYSMTTQLVARPGGAVVATLRRRKVDMVWKWYPDEVTGNAGIFDNMEKKLNDMRNTHHPSEADALAKLAIRARFELKEAITYYDSAVVITPAGYRFLKVLERVAQPHPGSKVFYSDMHAVLARSGYKIGKRSLSRYLQDAGIYYGRTPNGRYVYDWALKTDAEIDAAAEAENPPVPETPAPPLKDERNATPPAKIRREWHGVDLSDKPTRAEYYAAKEREKENKNDL